MGEGDRAYRSGSPTGAGSRDVPHAWWRKRRARPAALRQRRSQAHRREIAERARDGKEQYDPGERLIPRHGVAAMMWKSWTESSPLGFGLGEEITPQELAYGGAPSRCGDGLYRTRPVLMPLHAAPPVHASRRRWPQPARQECSHAKTRSRARTPTPWRERGCSGPHSRPGRASHHTRNTSTLLHATRLRLSD